MATRQTSSSGKPKSPRIQVVLPEELCERLAALAEQESRTVSNMAKVLIQQGVQRFEQGAPQAPVAQPRARDSAQIAPNWNPSLHVGCGVPPVGCACFGRAD